jgi:hypothetical protein
MSENSAMLRAGQNLQIVFRNPLADVHLPKLIGMDLPRDLVGGLALN